MEETVPEGKKFCECGCREIILAFTYRRPRRFKHNHHMRGKKRTEIAIKNISEAKKGNKNPMWKGGKYINSEGYIEVYNPDHPFSVGGYVMEHRLIMEKYLDRYLTQKELVHHINEIRTDNSIENLMILSRSEHQRLHRNKQLEKLV